MLKPSQRQTEQRQNAMKRPVQHTGNCPFPAQRPDSHGTCHIPPAYSAARCPGRKAAEHKRCSSKSQYIQKEAAQRAFTQCKARKIPHCAQHKSRAKAEQNITEDGRKGRRRCHASVQKTGQKSACRLLALPVFGILKIFDMPGKMHFPCAY